MRIAWFRAATRADPFDDTPSLGAELGRRHHVEIYDARRAHDFVWHQFSQPADVCVYELHDRREDAFVWPYLVHYPGVLRLRSGDLRRSRRETLRLSRRAADAAAEAAFAGRRRFRVPFTASRLVVVGDRAAAAALREEYPETNIRCIAPGIDAAAAATPSPIDAGPLQVGVPSLQAVIEGAVRRARDAGIAIEQRSLDTTEAVDACDAIVALDWPPAPEPSTTALAAMAAGRPVVVYESAATAAWPSLDPQTWRPRGFGDTRRPIAISLDPRDAEHSLLLALVRLATDRGLRTELGTAAYQWKTAHATAARAASAWDEVLTEAASLPPPALPHDWPSHLRADGTERARALLEEMGVPFPL